jgi:hypothetical protein
MRSFALGPKLDGAEACPNALDERWVAFQPLEQPSEPGRIERIERPAEAAVFDALAERTQATANHGDAGGDQFAQNERKSFWENRRQECDRAARPFEPPGELVTAIGAVDDQPTRSAAHCAERAALGCTEQVPFEVELTRRAEQRWQPIGAFGCREHADDRNVQWRVT